LAAEPVNLNRLRIITKILGQATDPSNLRTRDLLRLSHTPVPEIQQASLELQDLILTLIRDKKLDFMAVADQGYTLVNELVGQKAKVEADLTRLQTEIQDQSAQLQAEIAELQKANVLLETKVTRAESEKKLAENELAKRPTLDDLESRQKEIGLLQLQIPVLNGKIIRRERTIEVLQQREAGYIEQISKLEAEISRLSQIEQRNSEIEIENQALSGSLAAVKCEIAAIHFSKEYAETESEDTNLALDRALLQKQQLQANFEAAQQLVVEYRGKIDEKQQMIETLETQAGELRAALSASNRRASQLEDALNETQFKISQTSLETDALLGQRTRERDTARETAKELKTRLDTTSARLAEMVRFERLAARAQAEISTLQYTATETEAAHSRSEKEMQRELDRLQAELNIRDDRIDELQRDLHKLQASPPTVENQPVVTQKGTRELVAGDLLTGGRKGKDT